MAEDTAKLLPPDHIINASEVGDNGNIQNHVEDSDDIDIGVKSLGYCGSGCSSGCGLCCGSCFGSCFPCCKRTDDELRLPVEESEFRVYRRRWYILGIFAMMSFAQAWGWNTFGPIAASAKYAFGWSNGNIAALVAWGPTLFIISVLPFSYLIQQKGLRAAALVTSGCLLVGGGMRCITVHPPLVTYLMNLGQVGYSLGGPVSMAGASVLSATWFPASQRFTATALMSRIMAIGGTSTFIWGPRLVRDPTDLNTSSTNHTIEAEDIRKDIHVYMFIEMGVAAAIFLAILCYFPSKPPTPPSRSTASIEGVDFKTGLRQLIRHRQFWLLSIPYALSYGVYVGWSANLVIVLQSLDITQITVGWLGFVGNIVGSIVALILALIIDRLSRFTKPILVGLYIGASLGSLLFALVCFFYEPDPEASQNPHYHTTMLGLLYLARIVSASCFTGLPPIAFEVLCETTYPIPTAVNNGVLTLVKNGFVLVFLAVLMVPGVGTAWMNWFMVGSAVLCIPFVLCFRAQNNRLTVDNQQQD